MHKKRRPGFLPGLLYVMLHYASTTEDRFTHRRFYGKSCGRFAATAENAILYERARQAWLDHSWSPLRCPEP